MDFYQQSIKELKKILSEDSKITSQEWDVYAHANNFFSSLTLCTKNNIENFEELKEVLKKKDRRLDKEIERARKKLNTSIEKTGLNSKQTRNLSIEIDSLINLYYESDDNEYKRKEKKYPSNNFMYEFYKQSYYQLLEITYELEKFPTVQEWNAFATKKIYMSNQSLEYVSGLSWNELREKILKENNRKFIKA